MLENIELTIIHVVAVQSQVVVTISMMAENVRGDVSRDTLLVTENVKETLPVLVVNINVVTLAITVQNLIIAMQMGMEKHVLGSVTQDTQNPITVV